MDIIHCYNCDTTLDTDYHLPDEEGWEERDGGNVWICYDCIQESDYRETLRKTRQRNEATEIRALQRQMRNER